jgi:hexosaminidase
MHNKQKPRGFSNFLDNANTAKNVDALLLLTELVEPTHYYTRHHIKYQQNKYHQLAPLIISLTSFPLKAMH